MLDILKNFVFLIGLIKFGVMLYELYGFALQMRRKEVDLLKRYGGRGTWAFVTGASDGIGAEFCKQLAAKGFNICLVSRTMSKLQEVEAAVKKINPNSATLIVQADFSGNAKMEFYTEI
jgi:FlaA1/EpsC-like NDP-sugar epimerase